jgi:hypothetical protein
VDFRLARHANELSGCWLLCPLLRSPVGSATPASEDNNGGLGVSCHAATMRRRRSVASRKGTLVPTGRQQKAPPAGRPAGGPVEPRSDYCYPRRASMTEPPPPPVADMLPSRLWFNLETPLLSAARPPLAPRVRQLLPTTQRKFTGSPVRRRRRPCISNRNAQPARATFRRTPPMSAYPPISTRL